MKNLLFLLLLPFTAISQTCPKAPCSNYIQLPVTDVNSFNNTGGSRCLQNGDVPTNYNFNQWDYIALYNVGRFYQTLNASEPRIQKVYVTGNTIFDRYTVNDKDTMFVLFGHPNILDLVPNNHGANVIVVPEGGFVTIKGHDYYGGDIFQAQGNSTNQVKIIECGYTVLAIRDEPQRDYIQPDKKFRFKVANMFTGISYEQHTTLNQLQRDLPKGNWVVTCGLFQKKIIKL